MTSTTVPTDIVVGSTAPERTVGPLTRRMFVRYAGASGDLNPMHYDDELARSAGYPSVFAQGMLVAALLGGFAAEWLSGENVRRFSTRFLSQVWPGDELILTGEVTAITISDDGIRTATVTLTAAVDPARPAVVSTADFILA